MSPIVVRVVNTTGGSEPILAYSASGDNASLTYELVIGPDYVSLQNGNILTVEPGAPVGREIVDVSCKSYTMKALMD